MYRQLTQVMGGEVSREAKGQCSIFARMGIVWDVGLEQSVEVLLKA